MTPITPMALAISAALMFTSAWAVFLIVSNHFSNRFDHKDAQITHFQMPLWSLGTMIFLSVGY